MHQYLHRFFDNAPRLGSILFKKSTFFNRRIESLLSVYNDKNHSHTGHSTETFPSAGNTLFRGVSSAELQFINKFDRVGHEKKSPDSSPINWPEYVEKNYTDFLVSYSQNPQLAIRYACMNLIPDITAVIQTGMPLLSVNVPDLARFVPDLFRKYDSDAIKMQNGESSSQDVRSPKTYQDASSQGEVVAINYLHGMDLRLRSDQIISLILLLSHGFLESSYLPNTQLRDESKYEFFTNSAYQASALHFSLVDLSKQYYEIYNHNAQEEGVLAEDERMLHLDDISERVLEKVCTFSSSDTTTDASQKLYAVPAKYELGSAVVDEYLLNMIEECNKEKSCSIARLG